MYSGEKVVGIHLPADFCAEHEWGIKDLRERFGIQKLNNDKDCLKQKSTKVPSVSLVHQGQKTYLFTNKYEFESDRIPYGLEHQQFENGLVGAWDGDSFGIGTNRKEYGEFLVKMKKEIDNCNIDIFLGKPKGIKNAGLLIYIFSETPA